MKRLTDLKHDVKTVQDNVLTDLDADRRIRNPMACSWLCSNYKGF